MSLLKTQLPAPVLRATRVDMVSSSLLTIVGGMVLLNMGLGILWFVTWVPAPRVPAPIEIIQFTGGSEDGAVGETLQLESPEAVTNDPSLAEVEADESEIQEQLDTLVELADQSVIQADKQFELQTRDAGKKGSASGTGRRPLGLGPGNTGGVPAENRWFIRYGEGQSLEEYARQLDFFGIELGALVDGELAYVSEFSKVPKVRRVKDGSQEKRLYFTWQGGSRKLSDVELLRNAGVEVGGGVIFQFVPKEREMDLARLEMDYRRRNPQEIRRTFFAVIRARVGYEVVVTAQTYLK